MQEPGLQPGEIRTRKLALNENFKVTVNSVAGGSFTQVRVSDEQGRTVQSKVHQYESDALAQFAELASLDAEMEA